MPSDLHEIVALLTKHEGNFSAASADSGIPVTKLQKMFQRAESNGLILNLRGKLHKALPMSEDPAKQKTWSRDQCIAELRRVAELEPDRVITRNHFRVNGRISESTWNRHFGTFDEFRRAANLKLTRRQHQLERQIAKHAATDVARTFNLEKAGWEGRYRRPDNQRFHTDMVAVDVHDIECDPFWRRCFLETVQRVQPSRIILGGDLFDLPEFGKYNVDPRHWDVVGRIRWVHQFLQELRETAPDAEIILLEGNHEFRLLRHLSEATPALRAVLSDLHGFTVSRLLGLEAFQVNYVARMDLASFTERDVKGELKKNYLIVDEAYLVHHFPEGRQMGLPGVNGHHHVHHCSSFYSPVYGPSEWHQLGAGHRRAATYCAGEKWSNGFCLVHVDVSTKSTQFEYIDVRDHCVIGGQWYTRQSSEQ